MALNIFKNLISYMFSSDTEKMVEKKPLKYIAAGNGLFEVRDNPLMEVSKKLDGIPNSPSVKEGIKLHIPKVPFNIFNEIASFLREVYERDTTEGTAMVFYNTEKNEFITWIPLQENAGASSDYKRDEDEGYTEMCKNNILVMVAHSHPWGSGGIQTTGPSPSGTDDKDEKEAILYLIVGNVKGVPTTTVSTCPGGTRMRLKFFEAFQNPMLPSTPGTEAIESLIAKYVPDHEIFPIFCKTDIAIPATWHARCKKKAYTYPVYNWKAPTTGPGSSLDPAVQYRNRTYGYDAYDDEEGYGDYSAYSNYYYGQSGIAAKNTSFKDMTDEELQAYYDRTQGPGVITVQAQVDEELEVEDVEEVILNEAIDTILELTDVQIAQLIFVLIGEDKGSLINRCLNAKQIQAPIPMTAGSKADTIPGLKLVKHVENKGDVE